GFCVFPARSRREGREATTTQQPRLPAGRHSRKGVCWPSANPSRNGHRQKRTKPRVLTRGDESAGAAAVRGVARAALPSRRRQRKQTFFSAHREIGTTLPRSAIKSGYESQCLDQGAFWSTRCQLSFFLTCCFSITRSGGQAAIVLQAHDAHGLLY